MNYIYDLEESQKLVSRIVQPQRFTVQGEGKPDSGILSVTEIVKTELRINQPSASPFTNVDWMRASCYPNFQKPSLSCPRKGTKKLSNDPQSFFICARRSILSDRIWRPLIGFRP